MLTDVRATTAVLALRIEERGGRRTPAEERDLAAAVAVCRFAHTAVADGLGGIGRLP